jgi:hypothetical protein
LRTTSGWLAMGPVGINSVKIGDLIVRLGSRQAQYALQPLADGTHLLRGMVELESWATLKLRKKIYQHFKIR